MSATRCDCIKAMDALLAEHNTKLGVTMAFPRDGQPGYVFPHILTEKVEKRVRRGPALAIPSFCPFCGVKYGDEPKSRVGLDAPETAGDVTDRAVTGGESAATHSPSDDDAIGAVKVEDRLPDAIGVDPSSSGYDDVQVSR